VKLLVTGGAGFIGSHLVRTLLVRGDSVRVLDSFETGKRENLADISGELEIRDGDVVAIPSSTTTSSAARLAEWTCSRGSTRPP